MREILFRGKSIDGDQWGIGCLLCQDDKVYIMGTKLSSTLRVIPETVGQYIGECDTDGKRIFEGDIVDILDENEEIGEISWDEDTARFIIVSDGFCADFDNYYSCDLRVIGNVYDNAELLKEGIIMQELHSTQLSKEFAEAIKYQNESVLNSILGLTLESTVNCRCGVEEFDEEGNRYFTVYDENGKVVRKSKLYPNESLNGWTI